MLYAIWYHLPNLKKKKNTHGEVLLLVTLLSNITTLLKVTLRLKACIVKFKLKDCNFNKSNTPPWLFFTFLKLYKSYQIAQSIR